MILETDRENTSSHSLES